MIKDVGCTKPLPAGTEMWVSRYHGRTFDFSGSARRRSQLRPHLDRGGHY
jgi:hypothetical protein